MTSTSPQRSPLMSYPQRTVKRAARAVRCTPFHLSLFAAMRQQSVELRAIAGKAGVQNGYIHRVLPELTVENSLLWLIQVGVLRREVDGQGITDSFRLTPLGHQLVESWQYQGNTIPEASLLEQLFDVWSRWVRLPSWLQ